jgi:hypothetical protein
MNHTPHLASLDKKVEGRPVNIERGSSIHSLDESTVRPPQKGFFVISPEDSQVVEDSQSTSNLELSF